MSKDDKDNSDRHENAWKEIKLPSHLQKAREEQEREIAKKNKKED